MTNLYTVTECNGEVIARHQTAAQAAAIILCDDSADFIIKEGEWHGKKIYELWTRKQVANKPWTKTVVFSLADNLADAEAEIFAEVIAAHWPHHPEAMLDSQYEESELLSREG